MLGGPAAPESFIGALDNSSLPLLDKYTLGPSTQDVRLKVENELTNKTTWNVIGKIPGNTASIRQDLPSSIHLLGCSDS